MIKRPSKAAYHNCIKKLVIEDGCKYIEAFRIVEKEYFRKFKVHMFKSYKQFIDSNYKRRKKISD